MNKQGFPQVPKIDHVGIAVNSLEDAVPRWEALLGERCAGPDSPIARHLERRGEGGHHLCLRVEDLDAAVRDARSRGMLPIPPDIRIGAGGHRVAFLHPRTTGGVLLELSEAGGDA